MLGGIIVNVIVGILIFIGMTYFIGDTFVSNEYVNAHGGVEARELGQSLGIKSGDKVVKINGQDVKAFDEIFKPDALLAQNANLTVLRGGEEVTISIPSNFIEKLNNKGALANFVIPRTEAIVGRIENNTIASRVLKRGDRFVEINDQPIKYFDDVPAIVKQYKGDTISFSVSREGKTLSFKEPFKNQSVIGFYPDYIVPKEGLISTQYSLGESILLGPGRAIGVITLQLKAFKKIFSGDISFKKSLSGPVGMAKMYGGTWDWENLWRMTGVLSMVLAFMNLLPIPALDGGYVMFLLYEMVTGREASEKFFENAIKVGMAILLALMVFVFYNDIANLFTKK
jgi:regulator of sigma E protease